MKNRKKVFIVVGIVLLVVITAAIAIAMVLGSRDQSGNQTDGETQIIDRDRHIGVVGVVTKEAVASAFEGLAGDVQNPTQSGTLVADEAMLGETARFMLKTAKNGHDVYVDVNALAFDNKEELESANTFAGTSEETIDGLGDEARYFTPRRTDAEQQVAVIVLKDNTSYKFSLVQNHNDGIDITQTAAKEALVALAREANFSVVKD